MIHPDTPVMPGAVTIWEREVTEANEAVESAKAALGRAEYRLAHAKAYLEEINQALEKKNK